MTSRTASCTNADLEGSEVELEAVVQDGEKRGGLHSAGARESAPGGVGTAAGIVHQRGALHELRVVCGAVGGEGVRVGCVVGKRRGRDGAENGREKGMASGV